MLNNHSFLPLETTLQAVRTGRVQPLKNTSTLSAIFKEKTKQPVQLNFSGLNHDQQADKKYHGGKDKALHHYPLEHYQYWQTQLSNLTKVTNDLGSFGENISTLGMTEQNVHLGDIFKIGRAVIQVSQARQPCWKLNEVFHVKDMAQRVQDSLRTGWYYRVVEEGEIVVGDTMSLVERPEPHWPLQRLLKLLYQTPLNYELLEAMTQLDALADSWKAVAINRLNNRSVENWSFRLNTPNKHEV